MVLAGSINTEIVIALGATEAVTGGLSTAGILIVIALDVMEGEAIQSIENAIYKKLGIN